jgi:hypothetical protein
MYVLFKVAVMQIHRPRVKPGYVTDSGFATGHGAKFGGRFNHKDSLIEDIRI